MYSRNNMYLNMKNALVRSRPYRAMARLGGGEPSPLSPIGHCGIVKNL